MIHYFDRSRIETDFRCPRRRYWEYHYDGKGLQPAKLNQHLAFGGAVHEVLADILTFCKQFDTLPEAREVGHFVRVALVGLRKEFSESKGFQAETITEEGFDGQLVEVVQDQTWLIDHYCDLLEGLVVGWCLVRLPILMQEYRVVGVEEEEQLTLCSPNQYDSNEPDDQLIFLSRPDAILERRTDNALVILSFKTTSNANQLWLENFKTDQQTISEVLPVESRLGREVTGVQIEGLVKGAQAVEWPRGSGHRHHASPLVWGYMIEAGGLDLEWKARWEWTDEAGNNRRLGKGWNRQRVAERYPRGIAEWVGWLYQNDMDLLKSQFPSPPLVIRSANEVEEWQESVKYREVEVHNALVHIAQWDGCSKTQQSVLCQELAQHFPKQTLGCAYDPQFHSKCPCYSLCWGSQGNEPIGSGEFVYRVPNHPEENGWE